MDIHGVMMKTNSIMLVFYHSPVEKLDCQNTAIFQSNSDSFRLLPPWIYKQLLTPSE